jgi:hypothetical protein
LVLHSEPLLDRSKVVANVQVARGLDPRVHDAEAQRRELSRTVRRENRRLWPAVCTGPFCKPASLPCSARSGDRQRRFGPVVSSRVPCGGRARAPAQEACSPRRSRADHGWQR